MCSRCQAMKLLRATPKPRFCTLQDKQIQAVSLRAQLQSFCQSVLPHRNRDLSSLQGLQTSLSAEAISSKGAPFWHLGHQLRDTTKELRHDSTMATFSWGKVSLAFAVSLPRDFQWFALDKKALEKKSSLSFLSPSSVLQTLEFVIIFVFSLLGTS